QQRGAGGRRRDKPTEGGFWRPPRQQTQPPKKGNRGFPPTRSPPLPPQLGGGGGGEGQASARQFPAEPVADRAAHDELEVTAFEPGHLLGEHRHALPPGTWHAGDVGAPEAAVRSESLDDLLRVFMDVAV